MIEIRVASNPRFLIVVRAMIGQWCDLVECSEKDQRMIVLAVDEACANIIKHTYGFDTSQKIEICCRVNEEQIEIVLKDCGPPIDLEKVRPRKLEDIRPGGLGTHFIHSIMDEVEYCHEKGCGNVLRMVKHLRKPGSVQGA